MKANFLLTIVVSMLIVAASCKSKTQKDAEKSVNKIEDTANENSDAKQMSKK